MANKDINEVLAQEGKKKNLFKRFWWLIVLCIAFVALLYVLMHKSEKIINYNVVTPEKKDLIITVSATGNLQPTNSVDIGIEVSGTILEVFVDYNDIVKKGQILAKLDTTKLKSQVNSAKASLNIVEANIAESKISIKDAKRELQRVKELYKATNGNYPSIKDIDAATVTYEKSIASNKALLAQKEQALALLKSNENDLEKAIIISPIDGIVLDKKIDVGQSVVSSMTMPTLFTLAQDLKKMEVIVSVDEADVGDVKKGQVVLFTVDAYPNKTFKGIIKQVRMNSQIVSNVVTYETVVTVDNSQLLLRPGMTVSADITTKVIKGSLHIPNSALRFSPPATSENQPSKFVLFAPPEKKTKTDFSTTSKKLWILEDSIAKQIPVELGESDGVSTIVLSDKIGTDTQVIIGIKETVK